MKLCGRPGELGSESIDEYDELEESEEALEDRGEDERPS